MLNRLKNNEIYAFFKSLSPGSRLEWHDLSQIKKMLIEGKIADEELESLLFGTQTQGVYSGFTFDRVKQYAEAMGTAIQPAQATHPLSQSAEVLSARSKPNSELEARIKKIKFRERRRIAKAKIVETLCRVRASFPHPRLSTHPLKLNLGAGSESYPGYLKVDWAGPQHLFDDIVTLDKIKNNSVDEIYSNHVLEHIPVFLIPAMLKRWHEVLKPGGRLKLRMPDAKQAILNLHQTWHEVSPEEVKTLGFPNYLVKESTFQGQVDDQLAIQFIYGWSDSMPDHWDMSNQHKSLWTPELGKKRLEIQGFKVKEARNLGTLQTILIAVK